MLFPWLLSPNPVTDVQDNFCLKVQRAFSVILDLGAAGWWLLATLRLHLWGWGKWILRTARLMTRLYEATVENQVGGKESRQVFRGLIRARQGCCGRFLRMSHRIYWDGFLQRMMFPWWVVMSCNDPLFFICQKLQCLLSFSLSCRHFLGPCNCKTWFMSPDDKAGRLHVTPLGLNLTRL